MTVYHVEYIVHDRKFRRSNGKTQRGPKRVEQRFRDESGFPVQVVYRQQDTRVRKPNDMITNGTDF